VLGKTPVAFTLEQLGDRPFTALVVSETAHPDQSQQSCRPDVGKLASVMSATTIRRMSGCYWAKRLYTVDVLKTPEVNTIISRPSQVSVKIQ
jgi:hypothetical protein